MHVNDTESLGSAAVFLFFDLGKVLLNFEHQIACDQLAEVASVSPAQVREIVFESDLQKQYETGELTTDEFVDIFRQATGSTAEQVSLVHAAAAIFSLNDDVVAIVEELHGRLPMGVLSNTCDAHWQYAQGRFEFLNRCFQHHALSYRIGAMKPDQKIYLAAAEMAEQEPSQILFVDDLEANVAGAMAAGWGAIHYRSPQQLKAELASRGVLPNSTKV